MVLWIYILLKFLMWFVIFVHFLSNYSIADNRITQTGEFMLVAYVQQNTTLKTLKGIIIFLQAIFFYPNHAHVSLLVTFVPSIYACLKRAASAICICLQTVSLVLQTQSFLSRSANHFQYPYLICNRWCHWNGRDPVCKLTCLQIKQKIHKLPRYQSWKQCL